MTTEEPERSPRLIDKAPRAAIVRRDPIMDLARADRRVPSEVPAPAATTTAGVGIPTGIAGLDQVIDGLPKGNSMLLIGAAGSGKTVFSLHFANNACLRRLRTVILTTAQSASRSREQARQFGWDLEAHEKNGLLAIIELAEVQASRIELTARRGIGSKNGNFTELLRYLPAGLDILIMDSLSGYAAGLSQKELHDGLGFFIQSLGGRGITSLLLMENNAAGGCKDLALCTVQGAIRLFKWDNPRTGARQNVMDILKMGNVKTPVHFLTYDIDPGGFEVRSLEDSPFGD